MRRWIVVPCTVLALAACTVPDPANSADDTTPLLLDETAPLHADAASATPYLRFDAGDGWTQTIADRSGLDQWQHEDGCLLTTGNLVDDEPTDAADDRTRTTEILDSAVEALDQLGTLTAADADPVMIPHDRHRSVEFAVRTVDYTLEGDGTSWRTWYASRAIVTDTLVLSVNLTCPAAVAAAAPDRFHDVASDLTITDADAPSS
ncbi:MAG: hypothetical protein Q4G43_05185 [Mobilicoccus sp.]|nr:hypothetical protein [Mobilicoccus sp.]